MLISFTERDIVIDRTLWLTYNDVCNRKSVEMCLVSLQKISVEVDEEWFP